MSDSSARTARYPISNERPFLRTVTLDATTARPRSWVISLLLHICAALLALTIQTSYEALPVAAKVTPLTTPLIYPPKPLKAAKSKMTRSSKSRKARPLPVTHIPRANRVFAPPVRSVPVSQPTIVEAPPTEVQAATLPVMQQKIALAPPPPKLGNLSEAIVQSAQSRNTAIRGSGFDAPAAPVSQTSRTLRSSAGFGDASVGASATRSTHTAPPGTALEILAKPQPEYSAEARRLNIQGEVVVEARFFASGDIQILRIIRGLGHGLDESAAAAIRKIRFQPATKDGAPMDSTATIHVLFELAN